MTNPTNPALTRLTIAVVADSHVDHALNDLQLSWLLDTVSQRYWANTPAPLIATLTLHPKIGTVPCGLYGPLMGDAPISDGPDITHAVRGERAGPSRLIDGALFPPRPTRLVTLIAGPHGDEPWVLYTAFGGPVAPREPWDASLDDAGRAESEAFWAEHALSGDRA